MSAELLVRPFDDADTDGVWRILEPIIRAGETYTLPSGWDRGDGLGYWLDASHQVFVAERGGAVVGTYYLHVNQRGGGGHVANCAYATAADAQGAGVGRAMCAHSLDEARRSGFEAMQFNFVVSTNERASALWRKFGFDVVGTLPGAFRHPRQGLVDAYVMFRRL